MSLAEQFLTSTLGKQGATALKKAAEREPVIGNILLPRTIVSWLEVVSGHNYEGALPGIEKSNILITKNEDGTYTGCSTVDDYPVVFKNSDLYKVTAVLLYQLGGNLDTVDSSIKDKVLERLGRSIDILTKSQELSKTIPIIDLTKAISAIPKGKQVESPETYENHFDYSHVLSPEHKAKGYSLKLIQEKPENGPTRLEARVHHHGDPVGSVEGFMYPHNKTLNPLVATVNSQHKGKGLGQAMYEALFAHGFHSGVKDIKGDVHSSEASRVHQKLAQKHGLVYDRQPNFGEGTKYPTASKWAEQPGAPMDQKWAPYHYTVKQELELEKVDLPGKTAQPQKQMLPTGPVQPTASQAKIPRPPSLKLPKIGQKAKMPALKVGKSEATRHCETCDGQQFKDNKFVGCLCFNDLSKSIKTTAYGDGYALDFQKGFDREAYLVLSRYFRNE